MRFGDAPGDGQPDPEVLCFSGEKRHEDLLGHLGGHPALVPDLEAQGARLAQHPQLHHAGRSGRLQRIFQQHEKRLAEQHDVGSDLIPPGQPQIERHAGRLVLLQHHQEFLQQRA